MTSGTEPKIERREVSAERSEERSEDRSVVPGVVVCDAERVHIREPVLGYDLRKRSEELSGWATEQVSSRLHCEYIIDRIVDSGPLSTPEGFVDSALDALGPIDVEESTREALIQYASNSEGDDDRSRTLRMLRLLVSTPDFQYA